MLHNLPTSIKEVTWQRRDMTLTFMIDYRITITHRTIDENCAAKINLLADHVIVLSSVEVDRIKQCHIIFF